VTALLYIDPHQLDHRFSEGIPYQDAHYSTLRWDEIAPVLSRLPALEQDILTLYYRYKKYERDISSILGITQGAVSTRISRALQRLQYIREVDRLPDVSILEHLFPEKIISQRMYHTIVSLIETTCQSETARRLHVAQTTVAQRMRTAEHRLRYYHARHPNNSLYRDCLQIVKFVNCSYRKLHEITYSRFKRPDYVRFTHEQALGLK
jgi:DNA-directed RNA polymerase specialized sigma24 family protein